MNLTAYQVFGVLIFYTSCFYEGEMKGNYMNALQSVIKSMASCSVYYNMLETDVLLSSQEVNGAQSTDTVDKILKQIRKRRSEDEPRRGKNSSAEFKVGTVYPYIKWYDY